MTSVSTHLTARNRAGDLITRAIVPLWLSSGAMLKLLTGSPLDLPLVVQWVFGRMGVQPWPAQMVVVAIELVLALLIAMHARAARPLALLTLVGLVVIATDQVTHSANTCGCFGTLAVPAWLVLVIDAVLLILVAVLPRRRPRAAASAPWLAITLASSVAIVGVWAAFWFNVAGSLGDPAKLMEMDLVRGPGRRAESLLLFRDLAVQPSQFPERDQVWIVYRETCPRCHSYFLEHYAMPVAERVVAVQVPVWPPLPPAAEGGSGPEAIQCASCVQTSLPSGVAYQINVPLVIRLRDGIVQTVERP